MLVSLFALALASSPALELPRLLVLDPVVVNADDDDVRLLQRLLVQELTTAEGLTVVGSGDLKQLVDLGAAQSEAGCSADACLAEIAGAMGANWVVFSEVGRLGDRSLWQLGLFDQRAGRVIARHTLEAERIADLGAHLDQAVTTLTKPLAAQGVHYASAAGASPLFVAGVVTTAVGAGAAVVGAVGIVVASTIFADPAYDTGLRRNAQAAGPALVGTAIIGGVVAVVGGSLLAGAALTGD